MYSKSYKNIVKNDASTLLVRSGAMIFDFFRDVSHEMIDFGTIFGRGLVSNASKTYRFA